MHADDQVRVTPGTRHRDYVLTDYTPAADPRGGLQPVSLLRGALREAALEAAFRPIEDALRDALGPDETVWGLKYDAAGLQSVELYFYGAPTAPGREDRTVTRLATLFRTLGLDVPGGVDEGLPYFMCSLDLDRAALDGSAAPGFRVYVQSGEAGRPPCGVSYRVDEAGHHLENHYWFYPPSQAADVGARLTASPHAGARAAHGALLVPDLLDCHTICFATKPRRDGLYFSRLTTAQLRRFLDCAETPTHAGTAYLRSLLRSHAGEFAHARWDLGFDFAARSPSAGVAPITKVGVHGVF